MSATQNDFRHVMTHVRMSQNATPATRNEASRRLKPPKATTFAEFQGVQLKLPPRTMTNFANQNALLHKPVRFVDNMFMLLRQPWETFGPDNISQQPRSPPILELKPRPGKGVARGRNKQIPISVFDGCQNFAPSDCCLFPANRYITFTFGGDAC